MSKIAVVGATGHYGGKAIEYLLERGVKASDIIEISRNAEKALPLKEKGVEVRSGNYQGGNFGPEVFDGAEKLLFVSGVDQDNLTRIKDHITVVDAARKTSIKHIVYTGLAYPERAQLGMESVHLATEYAIKAAAIPYTFLRNTFYTEYFLVPQELKRAIDSGTLFSLAQRKKINFVSRDDMAKSAAAVLTTEGHINKIYEITAPKAYSYHDIADILSEVSGKKVEYMETTKDQYTAYLTEQGVPPELQLWDSGMMQSGFVNGWGETTDSALSDLIGEDHIKTPKQIIQAIFVN